jgi:endonuclease-3
MISKERLQKITELLKRDYPIVQTPLLHNNAFELLISVMLSAQTLDATVNKKTPKLFAKYKTVNDLAEADVNDVIEYIAGVNYFNTKAKNIIETAKQIRDRFQGVVPSTIEELTTLPGVGRKTANVLIGEWFARPEEFRNKVIERQHAGVLDGRVYDVTPEDLKIPKYIPGYAIQGLPVDTHVLRTSKRLGLSKNTTPEKVEQDLMKLFPKEEWVDMALRLIFHGRFRCTARNPKCIEDPEWSKICSCVNEVKKKKTS